MKVIVVGGGMGGLASALLLRQKGYEVTLIEKNSTLGGRCNTLRTGKYSFDTGPSLISMRELYDSLLAELGARDTLDWIRLKESYTFNFEHRSFTLYPDLKKNTRVLASLGEDPAAYEEFLARGKRAYEDSFSLFLNRAYPSLLSYLRPDAAYSALKNNYLGNFNHLMQRLFRDPDVIEALSFQTIYLGLAKERALAIYALLHYAESLGMWYTRGGIYQVIAQLERIARAQGITIVKQCALTKLVLQGKTIRQIETTTGTLDADAYVINIDLPYFYTRFVPKSHQRQTFTNKSYSSSVLLFYLFADKTNLSHHSVFFSKNTAAFTQELFSGKSSLDPSFYICNRSSHDPSLAPRGKDSLFVLVPVPNHADTTKVESAVKRALKNRVHLKNISLVKVTRPDEFGAQYGLAENAAFGLSHPLHQVLHFRQQARLEEFDNCYVVGASCHPGASLFLPIIGTRFVTHEITRRHPT